MKTKDIFEEVTRIRNYIEVNDDKIEIIKDDAVKLDTLPIEKARDYVETLSNKNDKGNKHVVRHTWVLFRDYIFIMFRLN